MKFTLAFETTSSNLLKLPVSKHNSSLLCGNISFTKVIVPSFNFTILSLPQSITEIILSNFPLLITLVICLLNFSAVIYATEFTLLKHSSPYLRIPLALSAYFNDLSISPKGNIANKHIAASK